MGGIVPDKFTFAWTPQRNRKARLHRAVGGWLRALFGAFGALKLRPTAASLLLPFAL